MDFTREPIIETIITPREGYRLAVRSSKSLGQEEHFVESLEVVSFGNAFFFRSTERPKPFLVPVADYEVLEVREPRMMLKTQLPAGSVKIAGGRDASYKAAREEGSRREPRAVSPENSREEFLSAPSVRAQTPAKGDQKSEPKAEVKGEPRTDAGVGIDAKGGDRRRERRRGFRRRGRGGQGMAGEEGSGDEYSTNSADSEGAPLERIGAPYSGQDDGERAQSPVDQISAPSLPRALLPPPTTLIRDNLPRLREENEAYRSAFYLRTDENQPQNTSAQVNSDSSQDVHQSDTVEPKGASFEEEPFLYTLPMDQETLQDAPKEPL
ncbi:MAG: hypothetical protein JWO53_149 [Chlamydiia bacterium]|nr:hypothetical protein [Chlamydiia bacterium]